MRLKDITLHTPSKKGKRSEHNGKTDDISHNSETGRLKTYTIKLLSHMTTSKSQSMKTETPQEHRYI